MPIYGDKPFQQAIDYLQQKLPLPSNGWEDVYGKQHDHAFMVAGAKKTAILEDFHSAIQGALQDGETLADFRKRFDSIVDKHGWDYNGSRGWRSKLIYETNIRQAYNAGREAQMAEPGFQELFPYIEYRHSGAENYRPQHKAWDRLVLAADDPWWHIHSPSNGYGCKCKKFPKSKRAMKRLGKTAPDAAPEDEYKEYLDKRTGELKQVPLGIDPGFEHTPGQSWLRHSTPHFQEQWPKNVQPIPFGPVAKPALPKPQIAKQSDLLPDNLPEDDYVDAFLSEFGANSPMVYKDVLGEPIAINDYLFRSADGQLKISKDKLRHRYMRLLARAIKDPDEIWAILEPDRSRPGKYKLKRRYIKRWTLDDGSASQPVHGFSAFEYGQGIWTGSTSFTPHRKQRGSKMPDNDAYLERQREGVNLYRREE